jgi:hypothetical protein
VALPARRLHLGSATVVHAPPHVLDPPLDFRSLRLVSRQSVSKQFCFCHFHFSFLSVC